MSKSLERNAFAKVRVGKGAPEHQIKTEPPRTEQGLAKPQRKKVGTCGALFETPSQHLVRCR